MRVVSVPVSFALLLCEKKEFIGPARIVSAVKCLEKDELIWGRYVLLQRLLSWWRKTSCRSYISLCSFIILLSYNFVHIAENSFEGWLNNGWIPTFYFISMEPWTNLRISKDVSDVEFAIHKRILSKPNVNDCDDVFRTDFCTFIHKKEIRME